MSDEPDKNKKKESPEGEITKEAKERQKQALKEAKQKLSEQVKEAEEKKRNAPQHLKTKPLPAIIMLLGGAAVTIDVFVKQFSVLDSLIAVFLSLVIFLIIGDIVKMIFDRVELPNKNAVDKDGEMIEKGQNGQQDQMHEAQSINADTAAAGGNEGTESRNTVSSEGQTGE